MSKSGSRASNVQAFSVREFFKRFPDDDACLQHVMEVRYGLRHTCQKCGTIDATFHRLKSSKGGKSRRAYSCASCGDNLYPCVGTIFEDSRTPLQTWFYAIYLFVTTRHGVSGKELQRVLGVTYKTGWRIGQQIRLLMAKADGFEKLMGHVELDEAWIGGAGGGKEWAKNKTLVMGLKEREGRIVAETIPDLKLGTLRRVVLRNVKPETVVSTDELGSYNLLERDGYVHGQVTHSKHEYARRDENTGIVHHVNNVESFWNLFKASVRGTHVHVSSKYMDAYLKEFTFRSNHRGMVNGMFDLLISAV